MFHYASVTDTPILMGELIAWLREAEEKKELHPVELAAQLHYKFVCIHPFDDGNGRISRLLMNYILLKNDLPPVIIKSADKKNYLHALHQADAGDREAFVQYIAEQLIWSLELSIRAANGESIEEPDDLDKELDLVGRELKGEDVLKAPANKSVFEEAIEQNIFPLFRLIEEKCKKLEPFFFDTERKVQYQYHNDAMKRPLGTKATEWGIMIFKLKHNQGLSIPVHKVLYDFGLKGFKKSVDAHNFWIHAEVDFNDYNYKIMLNHDAKQSANFPYGKELSQSELLSLITPAIRNIIENITRLNAAG